MKAATSLLDFILNLLKDPQAQAEFRASPEQVLAANGLTGVCAADIHETLPLVTDNRSVELTSSGHSAPPSVVPTPGESPVHAAIQYLHYITYTYEDNSGHVHDLGHENIWAVDDVTQTFDNNNAVSDGPGSVASGLGDNWGKGSNLGNADHTPQGDGTAQGPADHTPADTTGPVDNWPAGPTGSSPSSDAPSHPAHDQGYGHLHSFGSGADSTFGSGYHGSPATDSGNPGGPHGGTKSGDSPDSGNPARTTGSNDCSHTHDAHSSLGDSYYSQDSEHGNYDAHDEPSLHLYLH